MPLTSNSKAWLRIGTYIYPTTDLYGQEIPFGNMTAILGVAAIETRHDFAGAPNLRWQYIHVDAGGSGTSAYPIGG